MTETIRNETFNGLFILDLANNHQGDIAHALHIVQSLGVIARELGITAALKFQFRQLDSFIHPDYRDRKDIPHIPRFLSTRLGTEDYKALIREVRSQGMLVMCTPFDEESVDLIQTLDIDIIKLASCSVVDSPLVEKVASARMPTVISTGGASLQEIDCAVRLLENNANPLAIHHCVSIYPTPSHQMQLNQIGLLKQRYRKHAIGWSTHEDPDDTITVQLALAKGAVFFERHVGLSSDKHSLNKYSSSPDQIRKWLSGYFQGKSKLGAQHRCPPPVEEREALFSLRRGVYAKRKIKTGEVITRDATFFAAPLALNGLDSGQWREGSRADQDLDINQPLPTLLASSTYTPAQRIDEIMLQVRGMLYDARIKISEKSSIEISHHYGLERFREFGAVIIEVINREYCKKLIIQLPRQKHPYHYHQKKEETFQILHGDLEVERNGEPFVLNEGDLFLVKPGDWHKFSTLHGVIFEEISTTHYNNDSFYQDEQIMNLSRTERKTTLENWGI
jgi:sialic acid synthase SpsE/mannose-6-phosphate isomerase-like protein (cupin superfamily)